MTSKDLDQNTELADNLTFSNKRIVSGYRMRTTFGPLNGRINSLSGNTQVQTFEVGGTGIVMYPDSFTLNIGYTIPASGDNLRLSCVLKQPPITRIRISTRSGQTILDDNNLLYCAPFWFYGENHITDNASNETYGGYEKAIVNTNTGVKNVNLVFNLSKFILAFFNQKQVFFCPEVMIIDLHFARVSDIAYQLTVAAPANVDVARTNPGTEIRDRILYNKFKPSNLTGIAADAAVGVIAPVIGQAVHRTMRPCDLAEIIETTTSGLGANVDLTIRHLYLSVDYERNEVVDIMMKNLFSQSSLTIPYINSLSVQYALAQGQGNHQITHRVAASVGQYLRSIYFTVHYPTESRCLTQAGSFNTRWVDSARLTRLDIRKDGKQIMSYRLDEDDFKSLPFGFMSSYPPDAILDEQYLGPNPDPNVAAPVVAEGTSANNGRLRVLPKDHFFIPIILEEASDEGKYGKNTSIVAGEKISGDTVFDFNLTWSEKLPPGGAKITLFQYGVKFLEVDRQMIKVL